MKRRSIKNTDNNKSILNQLSIKFDSDEKRKKLFVKVSNSEFAVIKELVD